MKISGIILAISALFHPAHPLRPDRAETQGDSAAQALVVTEPGADDAAPEAIGLGSLATLIDDAGWNQVRIEQRLIIRITPNGPGAVTSRDGGAPAIVRLRERKAAKCLAVSNIFGAKPVSDSRLVLFTRDRRLMGADLDRMCHAQDFYSGFYVESASDGQLCVKRDIIHSRAGTTCKIARLHELEP